MKLVYYFGYGAYRDPQKMRESIGKQPKGGYGAIAENYNLCLQTLAEIPKEAAAIMEQVWGKNFQSYTIRKGSGIVAGTVWELVENDFTTMKEWNFIGPWRELVIIDFKTFDGRILKGITEKALDEQPVSKVVDGIQYTNVLNTQKIKDIELPRENDAYRIAEVKKILQELRDIAE